MSSDLTPLIGSYTIALIVAFVVIFKRIKKLKIAERVRRKREHEREVEQRKIGERILSEMKMLSATNTAVVTEIQNVICKGGTNRMTEEEFQKALRTRKEKKNDQM